MFIPDPYMDMSERDRKLAMNYMDTHVFTRRQKHRAPQIPNSILGCMFNAAVAAQLCSLFRVQPNLNLKSILVTMIPELEKLQIDAIRAVNQWYDQNA